ncbi:hypothetical protein [Sinomicrobium sp. M5D2P9]
MKKLDLQQLKTEEVLRKEELKMIFGGYGGGYGGYGDCLDDCSTNSDCPDGLECMCLTPEACKDINSPVSRCVAPA